MKSLALTAVTSACTSATIIFAIDASRFHDGAQVLGTVLLAVGSVVALACAAGAGFGACFGIARDAANARSYGKRLAATQAPLGPVEWVPSAALWPVPPPPPQPVQVFSQYAAQCLNEHAGRHALPDPTRVFTAEEVAQFHQVPANAGVAS